MFEIVCEKVSKVYESADRTVKPLNELNVMIPAGRITSIIGESGCGKTTFLRQIAGLEHPDSGAIRFKNHGGENRTPRVSVVFQEPRLFDWMTLEENISIAIRHLPEAERRAKCVDILRLVGLEGAEHIYPRQLSGGMAQRAGLARALVSEPDILLMDEAFSALDALTRRRVYNEFIRIHREQPMTVVLVTHDVTEAVLLSSEVIRFAAGRVKSVYSVDLPYPRNLSSPGCAKLCETILSEFLTREENHGI